VSSDASDIDIALDLQHRLGDASAAEVLRAAFQEVFPGRIAIVSSFGAESVVLLHLAARIDAATPVLFVDTGRHFDETLTYRDTVVAHLGLKDVRSIGPSAEEVAAFDADFSRATWDPDGCCAFRKVRPLERALAGFDAWISGRKRFQGATRSSLPVFEFDGTHVKVNPLASWSAAGIDAYMAAHQLPVHPLIASGYRSIGCAPCTSVALPGEGPRAARWRGLSKTECGIHRPITFPPAQAREREEVRPR
jgi:phosphoadenosine phosphosulfate reductase